ncbi:unnamed protein product [Paramecium sonneborni]|uniref:Immediate early response 3-interacting protein 1 n=1 Tax=Paramecium sonneborni TaxID=65129 RepID=A0A8S1KXX7_9CILI|nr:unnamed protein product [Paramecium sonneborni]
MILITLLEAIVLISNGFAILNEKRVLQKYGFDKVDYTRAHEGGFQHMKGIIVNWLMFARSMKFFLILANLIVILIEILSF